MISANLRSVRFEGRGAVLCVEMEEIIRYFLNVTEEHLTKEGAYELLDEIVDNAKKAEKERIEECRETADEHKELFEALSKNIGKEIRKEAERAEEMDALNELARRLAKAIREEGI